MAEIFNFYVQDNRTILFPSKNLLEPIMQEDKDVATWRFRIPKVLNEIDMSQWAWWFVYVNANGQEFSELLTLTDDIDEPASYSMADYDIDYGISKFPGSFSFALEAISTEQGGEISGEWHTKTYKHKVDGTLQGNQAEYSETESDIISALMQEVRTRMNQLVGGATPLPVNLKSQMTDHDKVYLYTGEEPNESTGYWYHWNGTQFVPGGLYGAGVQIDTTLSQSGQAADAKAAGEKIGNVENLNTDNKSSLVSAINEINGRFLDGIEDAVSDWLNDHPEATTTVQDGSLTLAKFTSDARAKITDVKNVFNVLNYGVNNTNVGDQSTAINAVIAMCAEGDTVYLPNGTYRITNPIVINKSINFVCDGFIRIVLSDTGFGVVIAKSYTNVYIRKAAVLNTLGGCVKIEGESEALQFVTLEFEILEGSSSGTVDTLSIVCDSYYTAYIVVRGNRVFGSTNANGISCIKIGSATLGEVHIEEARIDHAKNGLYVADELFDITVNEGVSSVCAINCIFENNANACYLKNTKSAYLMNCRVVEQMEIEKGKYFLTLEGRIIQGGYVGRTSVRAAAIRLINLDNTVSCRSAFFINAPIYLTYLDETPRICGLVYGGKLFTVPVAVEAVE